MLKQSALLTSAKIETADSSKGRRAVDIFRGQYNKAELDEESAQLLNEQQGFAAYLADGIRTFSTRGPMFPVYLEIEVGGKCKHEVVAEFEAEGFFVSDYAKDIMGKPSWKPGKKETVKFGRATLRELGFTDPKQLSTTEQIWARIIELGHSLCEPADGPAIRLALKDQPRGDYFWCAMQQISDSDGDPGVFRVSCNAYGLRWLDTDWANPGRQWGLGPSVVFRLRK